MTKFETWKRQTSQALRIYSSHNDSDPGIVMCQRHRDAYFLSHPGAFGAGEFGGTCDLCKLEDSRPIGIAR